MTGRNDYTVVVPTVGRPSLPELLRSIDEATGPAPVEAIVVDDRRGTGDDLCLPEVGFGVRVVSGGGRGPAAARNRGWQAAATPWVAFLDDDVAVTPTWRADLATDLELLPPEAAASQGRITVPLPPGRRPTDWERNVAGLEQACWATADMAYRRDVLEEVGGFDERFPRAFREDADLGLRVSGAGWLILRGERRVIHPVRPAGPGISIRLQAGNADDVLMRALHGPDWRSRCFAGEGRNVRHAATVAAGLATVGARAAHRRSPAAAAAAAWAGLTAGFAWSRIGPGPRTAREVTVMAATSAVVPAAAVWHSLRGWASLPDWIRPGRVPRLGDSEPALPFPTVRDRVRFGPVPRPVTVDPHWEPKAVLFDRDGTLIADRHYLGDPAGVAPLPGARVALGRVRDAGLLTAVVTNQSGVGRGLLTRDQVDAVNRRVDEMLGTFSYWGVCWHSPAEGCECRKPAPGLIREAAERLGTRPADCAVIGDIGADMKAAEAAGARCVLVPTRRTRAQEIRSAYQVAPDLLTAVDLVLGGRC